jgi:hypothetical protein
MNAILHAFRESLLAVSHPRFFETERGFQGQLLVELNSRLQCEGSVVEQEYQKRMRDHGLTIRPDIIAHVPFDPELHRSRREGNFVVVELKLRADQEAAFEDFGNLALMCAKLDYPLGIFVNIDSDATHLEQFDGDLKSRLHAFAVRLVDRRVAIYETHSE